VSYDISLCRNVMVTTGNVDFENDDRNPAVKQAGSGLEIKLLDCAK